MKKIVVFSAVAVCALTAALLLGHFRSSDYLATVFTDTATIKLGSQDPSQNHNCATETHYYYYAYTHSADDVTFEIPEGRTVGSGTITFYQIGPTQGCGGSTSTVCASNGGGEATYSINGTKIAKFTSGYNGVSDAGYTAEEDGDSSKFGQWYCCNCTFSKQLPAGVLVNGTNTIAHENHAIKSSGWTEIEAIHITYEYTEGGGAPSCSDECTSGSTGCADSDTKWTCGLQADGCYDKVNADCSSGQTCSSGVCSASEPTAQTKCHNGDVWYVDAGNDPATLKEECAPLKACADGDHCEEKTIAYMELDDSLAEQYAGTIPVCVDIPADYCGTSIKTKVTKADCQDPAILCSRTGSEYDWTDPDEYCEFEVVKGEQFCFKTSDYDGYCGDYEDEHWYIYAESNCPAEEPEEEPGEEPEEEDESAEPGACSAEYEGYHFCLTKAAYTNDEKVGVLIYYPQSGGKQINSKIYDKCGDPVTNVNHIESLATSGYLANPESLNLYMRKDDAPYPPDGTYSVKMGLYDFSLSTEIFQPSLTFEYDGPNNEEVVCPEPEEPEEEGEEEEPEEEEEIEEAEEPEEEPPAEEKKPAPVCGDSVCDEGETCEKDSCCGGVSVNLNSDIDHCGKCLNKCDYQGGYSCVNGQCKDVWSEEYTTSAYEIKECETAECEEAQACLHEAIDMSPEEECLMEFVDIFPYIDKPVAAALLAQDACAIKDRIETGDPIGVAVTGVLTVIDLADNALDAIPVVGNLASSTVDLIEGIIDCLEGMIYEHYLKDCGGYLWCGWELTKAVAKEAAGLGRSGVNFFVGDFHSPVTLGVVDDDGNRLTALDGVLTFNFGNVKMVMIARPEKLSNGYNVEVEATDDGKYTMKAAVIDSSGEVVKEIEEENVPVVSGQKAFYEVKVDENLQPANIVIKTAKSVPFVSFSDLATSHWGYDYVLDLAKKKVIGGYPDGSFKPNQPIARAELLKIALEAFNENLSAGSKSFPDVKSGDWFYKYVTFAADKGVVGGYSDGTFKPGQPVTRAEAVKIILLATGLDLPLDTPASTFSDVPNDAWYKDYVMLSATGGIVKGYSDGTFRPGQPITRAEASKIVKVVYDLINVM